MSSIISSIPASVTGYISGGAALTTIILCYVLAVSLGHVQPWLPMISDCGVLPPECFLFRAGLVLAAAALSVQVVSVFNAERDTTRSRAALAFGLLSAVGLAIIGVVSEKESSGAHTGEPATQTDLAMLCARLFVCYFRVCSSYTAVH